jgi:putative hydrolase of the HAD superfamily
MTDTAAASRPDLRHIDTWIFDLDNTLYPAECELLALCDERMTAFTVELTGLPRDEARALQRRYLHEHGTTLAGLMANHGVDPHAFLDHAHDIPLDRLQRDPRLAGALARLPGRRLIFTNGSEKHAARVLEALGIADQFEGVFAVDTAPGFIPKPQSQAFANINAAHAINPATSAFFEDTERNLAPAAELGMTTVLVGATLAAPPAAFVDHHAVSLPDFLLSARVLEQAA